MASPVLFISPHREDAVRLRQMLSPLPLAFDDVRSIEQARAQLGQRHYAVVLTETRLPDGSWLDVMALVRAMAPGVEIIVTDRQADARFWAEALNLGAYDLLAQPFYESEVRRILSNACLREASAQAA